MLRAIAASIPPSDLPGILSLLKEIFQHGHEDLRKYASIILEIIIGETATIIPDFLSTLTIVCKDSTSIRTEAVKALRTMAEKMPSYIPQILPLVNQSFKDSNVYLRAFAVGALGTIVLQTPDNFFKILHLLTQSIKDGDWKVREAVLKNSNKTETPL